MPHDISLSDDILDSRQIEERIEELEDSRMKWVAGWNMPGYMPDSDPCPCSTWKIARDYIAESIAYHAESLPDGEEYDERRKELETEAARIKELDDEDSEFGETIDKYHYWIVAAEPGQFEDEDDAKEFKEWTELRDECEGYGWNHGIQFIAESYFEEYAQQLADDIGAIDRNAAWPTNCIDWKKAARELKTDYTSTEIDGTTYYYREA
jgi:hypothetical protein